MLGLLKRRPREHLTTDTRANTNVQVSHLVRRLYTAIANLELKESEGLSPPQAMARLIELVEEDGRLRTLAQCLPPSESILSYKIITLGDRKGDTIFLGLHNNNKDMERYGQLVISSFWDGEPGESTNLKHIAIGKEIKNHIGEFYNPSENVTYESIRDALARFAINFPNMPGRAGSLDKHPSVKGWPYLGGVD